MCVLLLSTAPRVSVMQEGPRPTRGRVSIMVDGEEGRVCGTGWTDSGAKIVCESLGYYDGIAVT